MNGRDGKKKSGENWNKKNIKARKEKLKTGIMILKS